MISAEALQYEVTLSEKAIGTRMVLLQKKIEAWLRRHQATSNKQREKRSNLGDTNLGRAVHIVSGQRLGLDWLTGFGYGIC